MAHTVFISYAAADKKVAYDVCSSLESMGIKCWIAPRDVTPGKHWGEAIIDAISSSRVMIMLLSSSANASTQILREVERAANKNIPMITFRIEDVIPTKSLEYFISSFHWLDAADKNIKDCLQELADAVDQLIASPQPDTGTLPAGSKPKRVPRRKKQRSFLFWLGLISFVLSCGIITAFCTVGLAAHGHGPTAFGPVFGYTLPAMLLGILFIWLSRRQLRKRWFWPGIILFTVGLASSPSILSVLHQFPDVSPLFTLIASGLFVIIGGLCLWKGWPLTGVRHPRREATVFMITMLLLMGAFISVAALSPSSQGSTNTPKDILSFSDNFDDGTADGWTLDSGWSVVSNNGNYVLDGQAHSTGECAHPYTTSAENYQLESDFMLISGTLLINVRQSDSHCYSVRIREGYIEVSVGGGNTILVDNAANVDINLNQWHNVKIALNGGNIKVYIDQTLVIDCQDPTPIPGGVIFLGLLPDNSSHVRVDNIVIQPD